MSCCTTSFLLLLVFAIANNASAQSKAADSTRNLRLRRHSPSERKKKGGKKVKGSYIVTLSDTISSSNVKQLAGKHASKMRDEVKQCISNGVLTYYNNTQEVQTGRIFTSSIKGFTLTGVPEELAQSLIDMTGVIAIEEDMTISIDDPLEWNQADGLSDQERNLYEVDTKGNSSCPQFLPWGIQRIGGPVPNNNPNGRVFIVDTGIKPSDDLNIDTSLSIDFVDDGSSPAYSDGNGHGTHVAGTVAAIDNCIGVVGVVPGATLVAVRVLDSQGQGSLSDVIAGIEYVASKGKSGDVANLSLGGGVSSTLDAAVLKAAATGIKFAVAAGNSGQDVQYTSPARINGDNIFTVGAIDQYDALCSFSNYGSAVDFAGPGKKILSLRRSGGIVALSGTSMATPHIAGLLFANNITADGYAEGVPDSTKQPIACAKNSSASTAA
jgi:subtilisin family serine protease